MGCSRSEEKVALEQLHAASKTKGLSNYYLGLLAVRTRLELATPCVTGTYSNQLNYRTKFWEYKSSAFFEIRKFLFGFFLKNGKIYAAVASVLFKVFKI